MFVPLRNFGRYGVVADTLNQSLPVGTWTDARNMRFAGPQMEKMREPVKVMNFPDGGAKWLQGWSDGLASYFAIATDRFLYFWKASSATTGEWVLAGGPFDAEGQWQSFQWGDTCIFNNGRDAPVIFDQSRTAFVELPNWGLVSTASDIQGNATPSRDTNAVCQVLLPYKNFLVALGCSENGLYQPNTVWWSNATSLAGYQSNVGGGGPPDWDYESPASLSGKLEVATGSAITWGAELNESLIIYTDSAATALTFVGGVVVMDARRLFNKGCAGKHLAVEFNNQHMVVARDQIYRHDGSAVHLLAKDRIEEEFFRRAGKGGRFGGGDIDYTAMYMVKNPDRKEINLVFNETGSGG